MIGRRWAPPAVWAAVILLLTSLPAPTFAPASGLFFEGADKAVHVALYGVLGWLTARALAPARLNPGRLAASLLTIAAFAAADEWHQRFIPGRGADVRDWLADIAGAAAGLAMAAAASRRHQTT